MAVTYVAGAAANDGQSASASSITCTIPSSAQIGDTAVMVVEQNSGVSSFTAPSGWTSLSGPDFTSSNLATQVWVKDLVSGEPGASTTWVSSVSARFIGVMQVFRGTSATNVAKTYLNVTVASTSLTSGTITTTVANTAILELWCTRVGSATAATITVPGVDTATTSSKTAFSASPNFTIQAGRLTTLGAAGTYGGNTATASAASTANIYTIQLPPTSGPTGSGTVNLSGAGTLTESATPAITGSPVALSGTGTLAFSGQAVAVVAPDLALSGSGALSITQAGALSLGGSGTLAVPDGTPGFLGALFLVGDGQLAVVPAPNRLVFRGVLIQRRVPLSPPVVALLNFSKAVMRIAGEWVEAEFPTESQINAADLYFPGGYNTEIDQTTADVLTAAGYTVDRES